VTSREPSSQCYSSDNILYIAHVLNLVIQDILKALIKNDYDTSYTKDIYVAELDEDIEEEPIEQNTSKFIYLLI
jgi:hypothetical protein